LQGLVSLNIVLAAVDMSLYSIWPFTTTYG